MATTLKSDTSMNAQPAMAPIDEAAATPLDRSNILIVDDRLDKRVVFRTILEELDQNIITASSGEEALRWLLDNECAVILLDVNMPGMDGLETAELIRARRKSAHTPIIFITAFADEMHTARGYSLGAVDYILSPVVPNILRSKVKALVQLHRLNAELKKRSDERVALVKEQAARSMAEDSQRRASFLAEATQVMASSLDVDTILKGASGLVVPFLADFGAVVLVTEDGAVRAQRSSSVAGWDPYLGAHEGAFRECLAALQARVIRNGSHEMCAYLATAGNESGDSPKGEVHAFPLVTRGTARGALLLALGPSARRIAGADLSLADSLAGRAASALDNCLLYEEIQKTDQRKNEFLATLSHELRNPLAPMRAALHMLRSQSVDPDRSRTLLETMDRQVAQMSRLVEDLLDISRITRGAIELRRETLDAKQEIRNAVESCQGQLEIGGHKVALDLPKEPLQVVADRVRLQQILENVILNAAKYTDHGGRIEIAAASTLSDIVISVRDNGIGISPDKLQQVWDLFVQVDESPERIRKGLGIGLALVRDLVKRHGGSVEAYSEGLGKGSTFTIRIPRAVRGDMLAAEPAPAAKPAKAEASAPKRVLIVDDNVDAAETLAMMLELLGQQTRQAHEGNGALQAAIEYRPELVFMDIGLPGLSGHEVAARMRKELGMTDTYIVALSGYGTEEDRRKSLYAGFDSHLVKPLDPTTLPSILAEAERRRGSPLGAIMNP
jgi:signal transduction histidine kinase/DNA-binding response OmpR family regulator